MSARLWQRIEGECTRLRADGLHRTLEPGTGVDFTSNDYLGFARDPALRARLVARLAQIPDSEITSAAGGAASRLLRGDSEAHVALERRLAAFKGAEAALLFPNGYTANLGLLSSIVTPHDRVLSDACNHASIIDGLRLSGCRNKRVFRHLDVEALHSELRRDWPQGHTFVVTESLFSMEADQAPLAHYAALCARHGASLIVDDAHAVGVFGDARRAGLTEPIADACAAVVTTFGKALGCFGACITGPRLLREFLINRARPFIFTTAHPRFMLDAVHVALDALQAAPHLGPLACERARSLRRLLAARAVRTFGDGVSSHDSPIVPVFVGDNATAVRVAARVRAAGFDVRAVRPPTVAAGTARLRVSVHAIHTMAQIEALADALTDAMHALLPQQEAPASGGGGDTTTTTQMDAA